jgi:hypothetical protein
VAVRVAGLQRVDQHPVAALDRDLGRSGRSQSTDQLADAGPVVGGADPVAHAEPDVPGGVAGQVEGVRVGPATLTLPP